jgi:choice-of-anchor C domain-containing protein
MKKKISKAALLLTALLSVPLAATATAPTNLLINGGFEDPGSAPYAGCCYTFGPGSGGYPVMPGWSVSYGTVDMTPTGLYFGPADSGNYALDLNGWEPASISQSFATVAGQTYDVSFAYSLNETNPSNPNTAVVEAGGVSLPISVYLDPSYVGAEAMLWTHTGFSFVALSEITALSFTSTVSGLGGVMIDSVSVTVAPVPEPETYALMLLGLAVVGAASKRLNTNK